jgi:hypothetical protein
VVAEVAADDVAEDAQGLRRRTDSSVRALIQRIIAGTVTTTRE